MGLVYGHIHDSINIHTGSNFNHRLELLLKNRPCIPYTKRGVGICKWKNNKSFLFF